MSSDEKQESEKTAEGRRERGEGRVQSAERRVKN